MPVVLTGIDVVDIARFRSSLSSRSGLSTRLFRPEELQAVAAMSDPVPSLAGKFAAKEAVLKLFGRGLGSIGFQEIHVTKAQSGRPGVELHGKGAAFAIEYGVGRIALSISHSALVAVASVNALATRPIE